MDVVDVVWFHVGVGIVDWRDAVGSGRCGLIGYFHGCFFLYMRQASFETIENCLISVEGIYFNIINVLPIYYHLLMSQTKDDVWVDHAIHTISNRCQLAAAIIAVY